MWEEKNGDSEDRPPATLCGQIFDYMPWNIAGTLIHSESDAHFQELFD